jgi:hypothetical protein
MAWTVTASVFAPLPGAVSLTLQGDPDADVIVWRNGPEGGREAVRNLMATGASGLVQHVDPEAPFGEVSYSVESGGALVARSNTVTVPELEGQARSLLRVVLRPDVQWLPVIVAAQLDLAHASRSAVFPVIGRPDPVFSADVRQMLSGSLVFMVKGVEGADRLVGILRDGIPLLLRTPCRHLIRDMTFVALGVTEARVLGKSGWREVVVDFQQVAWPDGLTETPVASSWTYAGLLAAEASFATAAVSWPDYLDLVLRPVP